jgi:hypothetical protein
MALRLSKPFGLAGAALFALASLGGACDGDVLTDPTFRTWCGDELCAWTTESGAVRRAPTWHRHDYGVELVGAPASIGQDASGATGAPEFLLGDLAAQPRCLRFTTLADVDAAAQVSVAFDFDRDGRVDLEQPIAETNFRPTRTELTAPYAYDGLRVTITKRGEGRAVLAQMRLQSVDGCTAPPVERSPQPLGAPCTAAGAGECASGVCCGGRCSECCDGAAYDVTADDPSFPAVACVDGGRCGPREGALPEADGRVPKWLYATPVPAQCDPGLGQRAAGAACVADDDCASGACEGASAEARGAGTCEAAHFPDAGGEGCAFRRVRGGQCR